MNRLEREKRIRSSSIRGVARDVLLALAFHGDSMFPRQSTLAVEAGLSLRSVQRALGELRRLGVVESTRGRGRGCEYRVAWEAIEGAPSGPSKVSRAPVMIRQLGVSDPPTGRIRSACVAGRSTKEQTTEHTTEPRGGVCRKLFEEENSERRAEAGDVEGREMEAVGRLIDEFYRACETAWKSSATIERGPRPPSGVRSYSGADVDVVGEMIARYGEEATRRALAKLPAVLLVKWPRCATLAGARGYLDAILAGGATSREYAAAVVEATAARRAAEAAAEAKRVAERERRRVALARWRELSDDTRAKVIESLPASVRRLPANAREDWIADNSDQWFVQRELF